MITSRKKIFYAKLVSAVIIAAFIVNYLGQDVFHAGTPRIRPDAQSLILARLTGLISLSRNFIAQLPFAKSRSSLEGERATVQQGKPDNSYKPVAQGVYAKEEGDKKIKLYQENEVQWLYYEFDYKGKHYKIRYALSDGAPNRESLEKILGE
ncbi:hypothetical protein A2866_01830 [Candidatus Roizmanbacteria bacterium RIFCSPHIGHO2_01_FULL_39_8]|uniref:Uncharacterized protein n=1 Tax=Candidatus Roizmanbacteria bacterium RIFCSPHIGHO2_01_FULL_39_8 TaxID=1802033 RepID=A0A1F7GRH1_9BACT|nr:MAG: hypothetical protein A2866_01830 [Candidatus Roizmanbacteria bacterium RIFCSPHIGHO2_01_FULL_39_8]